MWWLVNLLAKTCLVICNWPERISSIVSSLRLFSKVMFSALEKLATRVNILSFCPNAFQPKRTGQNLSVIGWLIPLMILDEKWAHFLCTPEVKTYRTFLQQPLVLINHSNTLAEAIQTWMSAGNSYPHKNCCRKIIP